MYTLEDLEKAQAELDRWEKAWSDYSGNNPEKYSTDIKLARSKVKRIREELKRTGVIPLTEQEQLEAELDKTFPNAQSKEIVEFNGTRYMRRFFPLEMSRSRKTVMEWGRTWVKVE